MKSLRVWLAIFGGILAILLLLTERVLKVIYLNPTRTPPKVITVKGPERIIVKERLVPSTTGHTVVERETITETGPVSTHEEGPGEFRSIPVSVGFGRKRFGVGFLWMRDLEQGKWTPAGQIHSHLWRIHAGVQIGAGPQAGILVGFDF